MVEIVSKKPTVNSDSIYVILLCRVFMNFYQSDLRIYINKHIYKKPSFTLDIAGTSYTGFTKTKTSMGKTFRWFMLHGMERGDLTYYSEELGEQRKRLRRDYQQSWGDMFFQLGSVDILDQQRTVGLKDSATVQEIATQKKYQASQLLERYGLRPSWRQHMPDATLLLDLTQSAAEMKADFSSSCKRYMNKAKRAELSFHHATKADREVFWQMRYTMSYDKGFHIIAQETFIELMEWLTSEKKGVLLLVKKGNEIVSGSVYLFHGTELIYLYGATDRSFGHIGGHYLLTYEAMKRGRDHGYFTMDLLGVAPPGAGPDHDLAGVTRFKQSFGGTTVTYVGNYDLVFNSMLYRTFKIMKRK